MTERPVTTALGDLGARLRELRDRTGKTGTEFAESLGSGWRQSRVSKIETGRQLPTEDDLAAWARATGAELDPLVELRARAAADFRSHGDGQRRAGGAEAHQRTITAMMEGCRRFCEFQPTIVPGLLQTAPFITSWMNGDATHTDLEVPADEFQRVLANRVRRQAFLHEPAREFVYVVTEAALRIRPGNVSAQTLRHQVSHLAEMAALPSVTLGVIPFTTRCPVTPAGFSVYDRDLVRIETSGGALELTDAEAIARYSRWMDLLVDAALTGQDAADFCRQVAATTED